MLDEYVSYLDNDWYHFASKLLTKKAWWPDRHMELQLVSPFVHWLTSHYFYEDLCRVQLPEGDAFKCALAYQYLKKHDDFDRVMDFDRSFFGYPDDQTQSVPLWTLRAIARYICYLGLLLNML